MKTHSTSIFNIFALFALLCSLIGSAVNVTPACADSTTTVKPTTDDELNTNGDCSLCRVIQTAQQFTALSLT